MTELSKPQHKNTMYFLWQEASMSNATPVLIVGAGPTGLTMAIELQRRHIPFRIIDKQMKPVTTSNALAVQTRTLEVWDDMGLLTAALAHGNIIREFCIYDQTKRLALADFDLLDSPHPFVLGLAQQQTEILMHDYLKQKNIAIEMEVELTQLNETANGVTVTLQHKDGKIETLHTDWLIACDGYHSVVRDKLKIGFHGQELSQHFVFADVTTTDHTNRHAVRAFLSDKGPLFLIQFDEQHIRIIAEVSHDPELQMAKSLTPEQLTRLIKERCPTALHISAPIWTSGFWIHERIISHYQHNRVFFAGDAAHVHSPAGGQGMNTGIQDAYNLAWKLTLVIQKRAKEEILQSYHDERYAVAKTVLRNTTALTRIMTVHNALAQKLRNFLLSLFMKSSRNRQRLLSQMTELAIHYQPNLLVKDCLFLHHDVAAGKRMLDVQLNTGRLFDAVRGTDYCLLLFSGIGHYEEQAEIYELKNLIQQKYPQLIKCILITPDEGKFAAWDTKKIIDKDLIAHRRYHVRKPSIYLIRPDKYIGFRGEIKHLDDLIAHLDNIFFAQVPMSF